MRWFYVLFNLKRAKRPINFLVINLNLPAHTHRSDVLNRKFQQWKKRNTMSIQSIEYQFQTAPIANANIIAMYKNVGIKLDSRSNGSSSGVIKPPFITVMSAAYGSQQRARERQRERTWLWIWLLYFESNGWLSVVAHWKIQLNSIGLYRFSSRSLSIWLLLSIPSSL